MGQQWHSQSAKKCALEAVSTPYVHSKSFPSLLLSAGCIAVLMQCVLVHCLLRRHACEGSAERQTRPARVCWAVHAASAGQPAHDLHRRRACTPRTRGHPIAGARRGRRRQGRHLPPMRRLPIRLLAPLRVAPVVLPWRRRRRVLIGQIVLIVVDVPAAPAARSRLARACRRPPSRHGAPRKPDYYP